MVLRGPFFAFFLVFQTVIGVSAEPFPTAPAQPLIPSTSNSSTTQNPVGYDAWEVPDLRRTITRDGKLQFIRIDEQTGAIEVIIPKGEHLPLWSDQAKKANANEESISLTTERPAGCTCGNKFPPPCDCTPEDIAKEMKAIQDALTVICIKLQQKFPGLGCGWIGNVFKCGPKCNEVSDEFWNLWNKYGPKNLKCVKVVPLFDSGCLPCDVLAHIWMGIEVKQCDGSWKLLYFFDAWRFGNCDIKPIGQCSNTPTTPK